MIYVRAIHFAATIMATGAVFFVVFVLDPAMRSAPHEARIAVTLRSRLAWLAWLGVACLVPSGMAWLILTAASMSGQSVTAVLSQDVLWTVLAQTEFGNDWLARLVLVCILAAALVPLLSPRSATSPWLKAAAVITAAALVGSLAWAGHAIGGQGSEGVIHPAADVLHLTAAAAWVGTLVPLALVLTMTGQDAAALALARAATLRFSMLGVVSVAMVLGTGIVNAWYLVGSIPALVETDYGRLLLIKIALFLAMVGIAAINRLCLTPRLVKAPSLAAAQEARRQLRRNAFIEASMGAAVIGVVAVLGTLPPASHAHHQASSSAIPADAAFQHIHSELGMADVMIEPGRVGTAEATIHLWNDDFETLEARAVTLTLTAPRPGSRPITRAATQDADGAWHVDAVELAEPGNWMVAVDAVLSSNTRLELAAPIVIEAR